MATVTPQNQAAVANLYTALFNRAPDASGFAFWTQAVADGVPLPTITASFLSSPESTSIYPAMQTAEQFIATFYQTVFGRSVDASGLVFWTSVLNANGGVGAPLGKAALVSQIVGVVTTPLNTKPADLTDAQYAQTVADRANFGKKVDIGINFAVVLKSEDLAAAKKAVADVIVVGTPTAPTAPTSPPASPLVFALTASVDSVTGGDLNDTFNSAAGTLQNGDVLNGGAGTDTLNITSGSSSTITPTLSNLEIVNITSTSNGVNVNLGSPTGLAQVNIVNSNAGSNYVYGVGNAALSIANQTANVYFNGSTATALSLALKNVGVAGSAKLVDFANGTAALATTHSIVTENSYVNFQETTGSADVLGVTVAATGSNVLTLSAADAGKVQTLTVTGAGSVDFSGAALSALTAFTATGGGNIKLAANGAGLTSLNTGAGNDSVILTSAPAAGVQINGGTGTDTLGLTAAAYATVRGYTDPQRGLISGFDVLKITDVLVGGATFDLAKFAGLAGFVAGNGVVNGATATVTNLGANASVGVEGAASNRGTLALSYQADTVADALTLTLNRTFIENNDGFRDLTGVSYIFNASLVETVNVISSGTVSGTYLGTEAADTVQNRLFLTDNSLTHLNVSGDRRFIFVTSADQTSLATIDASALTDRSNIDASQSSVALTIRGGAAIDILTGGSGNDVIIGGGGSVSISVMVSAATGEEMAGGAGNDIFKFASKVDTRNDDLFNNLRTNANLMDKISDFVGNGSSAGDSIAFGLGANQFGAGLQFTAGTTAVVTAVSVSTPTNIADLTAQIMLVINAATASTNAVAQIYEVTVTGGTLAGRYLVLNNGDASIEVTGDSFISLTGITGALNQQDIIFAD